MDYKKFQDFLQKYDFDQNDLNFLNDLVKSLSIPASQAKPKKKLYSIRLDPQDMEKLKAIAQIKWLPYQTLISSILHQYVENFK